MLKWAIAKEDRRDSRNGYGNGGTSSTSGNNKSNNSSNPCNNNSSSTKSLLLRKRRKLSHTSLLQRDGAEIELISGSKTITRGSSSNQSGSSSAGCTPGYLKQHNQARWNNGSSSHDNNKGLKSSHCRSFSVPDNNNTCKKDRFLSQGTTTTTIPPSHNNIHNNGSHNGIINSSADSLSSHNSNDANNSCDSQNNADSKSLLYMSLDHLPLAIVKQYERMLQEQETEDNNNNHHSNNTNNHGDLYDDDTDDDDDDSNIDNDDDNRGADQPGKLWLSSGAPAPPTAATTTIIRTTTTSSGASNNNNAISSNNSKGTKNNKKSLSFAASTLPYRFKSKLSQSQKKIILPLHGHGTTLSSSAGGTTSSKSLTHNVSKSVKQQSTTAKPPATSTIRVTKKGRLLEPPEEECRGQEGNQPPAPPQQQQQSTTTTVATKGKVMTTSSSSPSPLSGSSAGGAAGLGTEIIRHARSRSLRTCSFSKTKANPDDADYPDNNTNNKQAKSSSSANSNSNNSRNNRRATTTIVFQQVNNDEQSLSSDKFYNLPLSPNCKSSTLPRARSQSSNNHNSHKSDLKTISSQCQTTQTYKSILKNSRELNNNNFSTANQNSIIENLDDIPHLSPSIRRPFQSLLNVSTQCNPPTPVTNKTNTRIIKLEQRKKQEGDDETDKEDEDDDEERGEQVIEQQQQQQQQLREEIIERVVKETSISLLQDHPPPSASNDPDHDTTDPQFLEKSLTFSFPAVTRCAKKLTLKRSELRKLERIRNQTDRLNRFLRKYYHECLPNLPEEEDSQCSPEEKSLSILRKHWMEESPEPSSQHRLMSSISSLKTTTNMDHGSLSNLFNNTTTSSSSISSSCSSSSSICSSSSSSDNDWRNYGHGSNGSSSHGQRGGSNSNHSSGSSSSRKSRQKRHTRSVLSNNETTLLPIIQEDSAEVSSASVKSLESRGMPEQGMRHNRNNANGPSSSGINGSSRISNPGPTLNTLIVRDGLGEDPTTTSSSNMFPLHSDGSLVDVKRDNMGDSEDHSSSNTTYLRNAFVTEGAEPDFLKLKGSFMSEPGRAFDLPPPTATTLSFPAAEEGSLRRNPQPSFTPPHPSPSSPTSLFHESNSTDNQSLSSTTSSHSHGYGSGSGTTIRTMDHIPDKSDDITTILPSQQQGYEPQHHHHQQHQQQLIVQEQLKVNLLRNNQYESRTEYYDNEGEEGEDEDGILPDDGNSSRATISSTMTTNANYPSETENETWNSHEYPSGSPCESSNEDEKDRVHSHVEHSSSSSSSACSSSVLSPQPHNNRVLSSQLIINNNNNNNNNNRNNMGKRTPSPSNDTAHFDRHRLLRTPSPPLVPLMARVVRGPHRSGDEDGTTPSGRGPMFSTPIRRRIMSKMTPSKKSTPRKLVRKPPVKTLFSGKGEVLIRTYSNGDYVTLHVVQAKNLQPSYRSSWKLAIKISLLPEAEATFTKSESVEVNKNRTWVKIDQKFSFEASKNQSADQKVFLSFWKRQDRKTSFLGWTTLNLCSYLSGTTPSTRTLSATPNRKSQSKTSQCWFKLRKRKMSATTTSAATYMPAAYSNSAKMNGTAAPSTTTATSTTATTISGSKGRAPSKPSPLPLEIETLEEIQTPESSHDGDNNHFSHHHHHHPDEIKSQFPNSATMDSGVEDCCEPPVIQPTIELDETQGKRIAVKMVKHENQGFGFSVVWVSPPRIERLEKDKTADLAGLRIGDLIIGVNGEDVTTVPNTTIYHNMKTTGNELGLEIWRKNPPAPTPATVVKSNNAQIGSMVMMLMTGTGTPLAGHNNNNNNPPAARVTSPTPPGSHHHHHTNMANNNSIIATSSPRHAKQQPPASSLSSSSTSTAHHHSHHHQQNPSTSSGMMTANPNNNASTTSSNINNNNSTSHSHHNHQLGSQQQQQQQQSGHPPHLPTSSNSVAHNNSNLPPTIITTANVNVGSAPIRVQLPPVSILKPPPPAPPTNGAGCSMSSPLLSSQQRNPTMITKKLPSHPQPTLNSSSWRIRFNVELLDNEEDSLKQFFICELKFFRKVVAALDRYLIPAQANKLLTPQEIHSIFAHIITIITMTKRILQCVANGAPKAGWRLGEILFSTHTDHLSEIGNAYSAYALNLGNSALILGEKMTLQTFARFVLETPVPKGHLDITSLLFAPLEHLRNLCEICDEIVHHFDHWTDFSTQLKECYANIVVRTDYMEPISHISMKKHPLLSVRDLEKRIVSTSCQPFKVNEKGRKWLFGSRLFRREADGSWAPVWAFLFTDIIVLTSHMTRDRVFFVKETPIRLEDVVTLHFNLPRKNENEFRLLFGPEPSQTHYGRFDRILPMYRRPKSNQIILRTTNLQLKSMWKLLLQRQIITLNTRLSKSSSSNFSISEFCEKFPENNAAPVRHEEKIDEEPEEDDENTTNGNARDNISSLTSNSYNHNKKSSESNGNSSSFSTPAIERKEIRSSEHRFPLTKDPINSGIVSKELEQQSAKPSSSSDLTVVKPLQSPGKSGERTTSTTSTIKAGPPKEVEKTSLSSRNLNEPNSMPSSCDSPVGVRPTAGLLSTCPPLSTSGEASIVATGGGAIKHPQSRTVHVPVPDNQQLLSGKCNTNTKGDSISIPQVKGVSTKDVQSSSAAPSSSQAALSESMSSSLGAERQSYAVDPRIDPLLSNHNSIAPATGKGLPVSGPSSFSERGSTPMNASSSAIPTKSSTVVSNDTNNYYNSPHRKLPPLDLKPGEGQDTPTSSSGMPGSSESSSVNNRSDSLAPSSVKGPEKNFATRGKFAQKPVEMLVSPSEGSPSKSYLNSRKTSKAESLINNNNDNLHDLNSVQGNNRRGSIPGQGDNKCECEETKGDAPLKGSNDIMVKAGSSSKATPALPINSSSNESKNIESITGLKNINGSTIGINNRGNVMNGEGEEDGKQTKDCSTSTSPPPLDSYAMETVALLLQSKTGANLIKYTTTATTAAGSALSSSNRTASPPCDKTQKVDHIVGNKTAALTTKSRESPLKSLEKNKNLPLKEASELLFRQILAQGEHYSSSRESSPNRNANNSKEPENKVKAEEGDNNNKKCLKVDVAEEKLVVGSIELSSPPPATASVSSGKVISGPKIMTNATLKSRQQELRAAAPASASGDESVNPVVVPEGTNSGVSEKIIAGPPKPARAFPSPLATTRIGVTYEKKDSRMDEPIVPLAGALPSTKEVSIMATATTPTTSAARRNVIAPSKMELERHPTDVTDSNSCAKGKVCTNSPIVSGIGSDRSRRRLLYDYKVRRDYPELFGITPRDRRSFIKRLGDRAENSNEKDLVAPYYYHARLSPLLGIKPLQAAGMAAVQPLSLSNAEDGKGVVSQGGEGKDSIPVLDQTSSITLQTQPNAPPGPPSVSTASATSTGNSSSVPTGVSIKGGLPHMRLMGSLEDEEDDASTSTGSISHAGGKRTNNSGTHPIPHKEGEEVEEYDSDDASVVVGVRGRGIRTLIERPDEVHHRRRRSPEESSSNDSGISEEILIVTDGGGGHGKKDNASISLATEVSEDMTLSTTTTDSSDAVKSRRFPSTLREHEVNSSSTRTTCNLNRCAVPSNTCAAPTTTTTAAAPTNNCPPSSSSVHVVVPPKNTTMSNSRDKSSQPTSTSAPPSSKINKSSEATLVQCETHSPQGIITSPQAKPVLSAASTTSTPPRINNQSAVVVAQSHSSGDGSNTDDNCMSMSSAAPRQNSIPSMDELSSTESKMMNHVCFVEGETTDGVQTVAELEATKADKATGMEDDEEMMMDFSAWIGRLPEKAYRNLLLSERREAFFLSNHQSSLNDSPPHYPYHRHYPQPDQNRVHSNSSTLTTITSPSHASSGSSPYVLPPKEPLLVKIYEGGTVHSTIQQPEPSPSTLHNHPLKSSADCERVMYTRLEQQTTARVERVESSDDSTSSSSDVASASPAAENGTTDPSWSSSSSSLAGYSSSMKEEPSPSTSAVMTQQQQQHPSSSSAAVASCSSSKPLVMSTSAPTASSSSSSMTNGHGYHPSKSLLVSSFLDNRSRPEIVVTGEDSPDPSKNGFLLHSDEDEEDDEQANSSIISNSRENHSGSSQSGRNEFLRVESNDSTAENYGDDDDYNFDDDDEELSHCSIATMNRYGTYESLEKIENEESAGTMSDFPRNMPRSKARFTFDDDDDDDDDLFEEDFESDFNFRFPTQIQDNTYSVSRLGPLPPLLEEDYEDEMYDEGRAGSESPSNSTGEPGNSHKATHHPHNEVHQISTMAGSNSSIKLQA